MPRADAVRNRQRILAAARTAFADDGPGVSLDDVARRAGVGPGTVHRHFPTKDALFTAVITDRLQELAGLAAGGAGAADAGAAFFAFLTRMAGEAAQNLALSAAITDRAGIGEAVQAAGRDLEAAIAVLLRRAQAAGAVRADLDPAELHAVIAGAVVMEQRLPAASKGRGLRLIADGLAP
ncbi:TetR/AcrR family transcriptional regulator [Dactylosporangium matsuzakiense]|uniref:Transcriptional regulator n=1 Tax=Dactylosporangium matsuzakiense TaxID=53360 RepID=A0A9W6NPD7_9ACTN|nr:TetR/AcrR family transcriptional regulator [Dactylosporangium matsuzakiense]GLL04945.1 transcriptional regulator [Dactylosporangium matsuzakiense]